MQTLTQLFASFDDVPQAGVVNGVPIACTDVEIIEGLLPTAAEALTFMRAGKATVTLRSKKTQARYTYKISKSEDGAVFFIGLMNGPDNERAFSYMGYIRRDVYFHGGAKSKAGGRDTPSNKAFAWAWEALMKDHMPATMEIWHEGRCGMCNRKLTVPSSIRSGIGPDCATRMVIHGS